MGTREYTYGIEYLDKVIGDALGPGTTILIAGHPGAGKTTLAATICYANAVKGKPCLYISLYEHKDKFIKQMMNFNMDFSGLERKGLFKFIRLPVMAAATVPENLINQIQGFVREMGAKVIVIDGVSPIIEASLVDKSVRPFIHTTLYELARILDGILILVADLPFGAETVDISGIEFAADIVILMKHRVESGLLVRTMEIRKVRGAPLTVAEIPFRLAKGRGIIVYAPLYLEEAPSIAFGEKYKIDCPIFDEYIEYLHPGHMILYVHPPYASIIKYIAIILGALTLDYNLKPLIISFKRSPDEMRNIVLRTLASHKLVEEYFMKIGVELIRGLDELLKRYRTIFVSLNPATYSLEEIFNMIYGYVARHKPRLLIFDDFSVLVLTHRDRFSRLYTLLRNLLLLNRAEGVISCIIYSKIDDYTYNALLTLADIYVELVYAEKDVRKKPYLILWAFTRSLW